MIWINCNPQAGREMMDIHPFLVLSAKAFNEASYILGHQPKSFDWRAGKQSLTRGGKFRKTYLLSHARR